MWITFLTVVALLLPLRSALADDACQQRTPPSAFSASDVNVRSNRRDADRQKIYLAAPLPKGSAVGGAPDATMKNYAICQRLASGANDRATPVKTERVETTEALQAALALDCPRCAEERLILVPEGIFVVNRALQLCVGCVLRGAGAGKTVIRTTDVSLRLIRMKDRSRVEHLTVEGAWNGEDDSFDHTARQGFGIVANQISDFSIINVEVRNNSGQGIVINESRAGCLWGVSLKANGHRGINVSSNSHHIDLYRITGQRARLAHVLFGHGSHDSKLVDSTFSDMMTTQADTAQRRENRNGFVWLTQDVRNIEITNLTLQQKNLNPMVNPVGLLLSNTRDNKIRGLRIYDVPIGIHFMATRVDLMVGGLSNDDTRMNEFDDVVIESKRLASAVAAIRMLSSRKYFVPGRCSLRYLTTEQMKLLPSIRDNTFSRLRISGYKVEILEIPSDAKPDSILSNAVRLLDSKPLKIKRLAGPEDLRGAAGW